jgi:hypothetical protein
MMDFRREFGKKKRSVSKQNGTVRLHKKNGIGWNGIA